MATAVNQNATGNSDIDGVLSGVRWSGTVTYSFPDLASDYPASYSPDNEPLNGFSQISAQQQLVVHAIMQEIVNYTNVTITFAGSNGADIRLAHSTAANPTAWAYFPNNSAKGTGGDVWFGDDYTSPVVGNYEYLTHVHEIGHAFGLAHGHEGGVAGPLPANHDSLEYTVMTYRSYVGGPTSGGFTNEQFGFPQTFMMSDIAALQTMYGADYTYNSGNTVYSWNPGSGTTFANGVAMVTPGGNRIFMTVWDGGGVDTYNFSSYSTSVTVNLAPGGYSIGSQAQLANLGGSHFASGNVYNAYLFQGNAGSYIENAVGGSGGDFIYGNDIANVLTGNGGNDTLNGGLGNDTLIGGTGSDTYYVDNVGDIVTENVGEGTDTALSFLSSYTLGPNVEIGGVWLATGSALTGNALDNQLFGGIGNDTLIDDIGNDLLDGGVGADTMSGGVGNDIYYVDNLGDVIVENVGAGNDTVFALVSGYTLANNIETGAVGTTTGLTLIGNALNNNLYGNTGNDTLRGGGGNDVINGGIGADTMIGGIGDDIYNVDSLGDVVTENAGEGIDVVGVWLSGYTLPVNVEIGGVWTTASTTLTGNALDNQLFGNAGNDTIYGGAGNDVINGGAGADTMVGGIGNDVYNVDNLGDVVTENPGEGIDVVGVWLSGYTLAANVEIGGVWVTTATTLTGNSLDNTLYGNIGNDTLIGGSGNDSLVGGAGADTMIGGIGNDTYTIDNLGDVVTENLGEGTDTIGVMVSGYTLAANVEIGGVWVTAGTTLTGNSLDNQLYGNVGNDTLIGGSGNDSLVGGAGADAMIGGIGNDIYTVDNLNDVVTENLAEGTDTVGVLVSGYTLAGNVEIGGIWTTVNTVLTGNSLDNQLFGNIGNDTLSGDSGNDTLFGGAGNDTFIYSDGFGQDRITDFKASGDLDQIDLSGLTGFDTFADVQSHATQVGADTMIMIDANNSLLLAGVQLSSLSQNDFLF